MRELLADEIARQAAACLEYVRRGGDLTLWLDSKSFTRDDRAAIVSAVRSRCATGNVTVKQEH